MIGLEGNSGLNPEQRRKLERWDKFNTVEILSRATLFVRDPDLNPVIIN